MFSREYLFHTHFCRSNVHRDIEKNLMFMVKYNGKLFEMVQNISNNVRIRSNCVKPCEVHGSCGVTLKHVKLRTQNFFETLLIFFYDFEK